MGRGAWGGLAIFCLAFIVFEVAKHGGMAWVTAVVFAILPDLTMLVGGEEGRLAGGCHRGRCRSTTRHTGRGRPSCCWLDTSSGRSAECRRGPPGSPG
ncbi:hypothetical protein ACFSTC_49425 [Nonomuraea ferruginea]